MSDRHYDGKMSPVFGKKKSLAERQKFDQAIVEQMTQKRIDILRKQEKMVYSQMKESQQLSSKPQSLSVRLVFKNF